MNYLGRALELARAQHGRTADNPSVGCVIVAGGEVVGAAATADGGRPHAETQALAQAGARARGASAYVTLEPCAHHGRTPPCADALIAAGIGAVTIGFIDPDARVCWRGAARLQEAGIDVALDLRGQIAEFYADYARTRRTRRGVDAAGAGARGAA